MVWPMISTRPKPCVGRGVVKAAAPPGFCHGASEVASLGSVAPLLSGRMVVTACEPKVMEPV